LDGAFRRLSRKRLQVRKGHLDGVQVGTARRREAHLGDRGFDKLPRGNAFAAEEIAYNDDVAAARQVARRDGRDRSP